MKENDKNAVKDVKEQCGKLEGDINDATQKSQMHTQVLQGISTQQEAVLEKLQTEAERLEKEEV